MRPTSWVSLLGDYELEDGLFRFQGKTVDLGSGPSRSIGNFICNLSLGSGSIQAKITFHGFSDFTAAALILYHRPDTGAFVTAQLGGASLCSVQIFGPDGWKPIATTGEPAQLVANRPYSLRADVKGSKVNVTLDNIRVIDASLPIPLPRGQTGVWATGRDPIEFADFEVETARPTAFVVMQFTEPFDELHRDVVRPVAEAAGYNVVRADETCGPGMIIADVERQIREASVVIADITPVNANVFWEVGYAHALRKPTVLIAERTTKLPFDISGFRVLFYENTIAGKARVEEGLRKHLAAIQGTS